MRHDLRPDAAGRVQEITDDLGTLTELDWSTDNYITRYEVAAGTAPGGRDRDHLHPRSATRSRSPTRSTASRRSAIARAPRTGPTNGGVDDGTQYVTDLTSLRRPARANTVLFPAPTVTFGLDDARQRDQPHLRRPQPAETAYGSYGLVAWEEDEREQPHQLRRLRRQRPPAHGRRPAPERGRPRQPATTAPGATATTRSATCSRVTDPRGGTTATPGQPYTTSFNYDPFDRVLESLHAEVHRPQRRDSGRRLPDQAVDLPLTEYDDNGNPTRSTDGTARTTDRDVHRDGRGCRELTPEVNHHGEQDRRARRRPTTTTRART